jgi:hypothetical protein
VIARALALLPPLARRSLAARRAPRLERPRLVSLRQQNSPGQHLASFTHPNRDQKEKENKGIGICRPAKKNNASRRRRRKRQRQESSRARAWQRGSFDLRSHYGPSNVGEDKPCGWRHEGMEEPRLDVLERIERKNAPPRALVAQAAACFFCSFFVRAPLPAPAWGCFSPGQE